MKGLVLGLMYKFEVYGNFVCGEGVYVYLFNGVKMEIVGEY